MGFKQTMRQAGLKRKTEFLLYNDLPIHARHDPVQPDQNQHIRPATFQNTMMIPVLIAQCFGLFPVIGICETDVYKLRFTFSSGRCVYSLFTIFGQCFLVLFTVFKMFRSDSNFYANSSVVFYGTNCLTGIIFLRLAMVWPKLCQKVAKTELADPIRDKHLVLKCRFACIFVLVLASLEHTLSILSGLAVAIDCQPGTVLYKAYLLESFQMLWIYIPYNTLVGFIAKFINLQCTFNWNFADVMIICISFYLTTRLQQISDRVIAIRGKFAPAVFWRTLREDYSRIICLVRNMDDAINGIIFVSFAMNLFIICMQLLHALEDGIKPTPACHSKLEDRPMKGYEQSVYFIYSFSFLLSRSLAVSLIASRVHSASRAPAKYLYDVPSAAYCFEIQRFLNQVHGDAAALTGLQFFNVKRGLVLTITGTVITYELVLMQLVEVSPSLDPASGMHENTTIFMNMSSPYPESAFPTVT